MSASVLIPAHNEQAVIASTLGHLLDGLRPDVEVLVACNGCADQTADIARRIERVAVIELEQASKTAALNAGDAHLEGFPRLYVDADIVLRGVDATRLIEALESAAAPAAEPRPVMDTHRSGALVRAYYAVWTKLHGSRPGDVGSGVYGLSEAGRARFGQFPAVISDDGFVRAHFAPGEILEVAGTTSQVQTPRTLRALIRIKSRSRLGALQLSERFPSLWARKRGRSTPLLGKVRALPLRLWPLTPLYAAIQLAARLRASRQVRDLDGYRWERDDRRE